MVTIASRSEFCCDEESQLCTYNVMMSSMYALGSEMRHESRQLQPCSACEMNMNNN